MTEHDALPESEARGGSALVVARRIGLIADDHGGKEDGGDLPPEVLVAFEGVDLIVHLGHMGFREILARGVLDLLEKVAPVLAVRDFSTDAAGKAFVTPAEGRRVAGLTRVIEVGRFRVGAVHNLERPPGPAIPTPPGGLPDLRGISIPAVVTEKFGGPVDIVAYAGSHRAAAATVQGVLFVNPGSPTYPKGPGREAGKKALGTVGILDLADDVAIFETVELSLLSDGQTVSGSRP